MAFLLRLVVSFLALLLFSSGVLSYEAPTFYEDEIIVTASRRLELSSESPFNITVISSREIESSGRKKVSDILRSKFGTYPKSKGALGAENSLSLRGSAYQQVLILLDGVNINSPLLGGVDIGDISITDVKRIEVVRGPLSSMYGSDAVGGVVNIITRDTARDGVISVDARLMELGAGKVDASYFGETDTSEYYLTLGYNQSPGYRINSEYKSRDLSLKVASNIFGKNFDLLYKTYGADKEIPGSTVFSYADAWQKDNNNEVILSFDGALQTKLFYLNQMQLINLSPSSSPNEKYNSYSTGGDVVGSIYLIPGHTITTGISLKNNGCDSTYAGVREIVNGAVFAEDKYEYNDDIILNLGARIDSHSIFGASTNPRIGLLYKANSMLNFRAVYGEAFRAPTLNDLYWSSVDPVWGTVMNGSTSLKPEKAKSYEIGVESRISDRLNVDTSVYTSQVENLIQWVDISGTWATWEAQNVGNVETSGFECDINYYLARDIKLYANYTFQQAFDLATKNYLVYRPKDQYNAGIDYRDENGNIVYCNLSYVGDRFDNSANTNKVAAYSVLDIKYERVGKEFSFYLGADNLLNAIYEDTLNYPMPGRIYYFGIKYKI